MVKCKHCDTPDVVASFAFITFYLRCYKEMCKGCRKYYLTMWKKPENKWYSGVKKFKWIS